MTDLLLTHENEIEPDLLQQFYTYIRNFCVLLINAGSSDIAPMLHHLHEDTARGYLYHEGKLTASAYISVATAALRVKFRLALGLSRRTGAGSSATTRRTIFTVSTGQPAFSPSGNFRKPSI